MLNVIRALFQIQILSRLVILLSYSLLVVLLLNHIGFWNISYLKDTIFWYLFSAIALLFKFVTSDNNENLLRSVLVDSLKIIIILEFLVNSYTFPFLIEFFVIIPILTFIAILDTVASRNPNHSGAAQLIQKIQIFIGIVILLIVVIKAIIDFQNLSTFDNLKQISLVPLLSILLTPYLYLNVLLARYEDLFVLLEVGIEKDKKLKRYTKWCVYKHVGINLKKLQYLHENHRLDFLRINSKEDVITILYDK